MRSCRVVRSSSFGFNEQAYQRASQQARLDPETFWKSRSDALRWATAPSQALPLPGSQSWFPGGRLNTAQLAVDDHVAAGRGGMEALRFDSLVSGEQRRMSYVQLQAASSAFGRVLQQFGANEAAPVMLYMPTLPEAAVVMLGAARIASPHCVVFAGFAAAQLASRIDHVKPAVLVTCDYSLEAHKKVELLPLVRHALELARHNPRVIVLNRSGGHSEDSFEDYDTHMKRTASEPLLQPVSVPSAHALYYLHTSGTTGAPKALVREHGSHAVALRAAAREIMGLTPGHVMWAASDVGWVVGHSFSVYGPLLAGATSLLVEGKPVGTPDHLEWWRVLERHGVNTVFCAPTALRAIRRESSHSAGEFGGFNLSALRAWFVAGEKCDTATYHWLNRVLGGTVPVCDNWWQTETGWPISSRGFLNSYGIAPHHEGSCGIACPGYDLSLSPNGDVLIKLPLPPGAATRLLGDDENGSQFKQKYCVDNPGYYLTGDSGSIDAESGALTIEGRVDDVINVAGHRLTTGQIEEAISRVPLVAECAVVGKADQLKGHVPVAFVVGSVSREDVIEAVRQHVGAVASLKQIHLVAKLPKTRSGKILRNTLREIVAGNAVKVPPTIEDESVIDTCIAVVRKHK